jgi:hypothetical protein
VDGGVEELVEGVAAGVVGEPVPAVVDEVDPWAG